MQSVEFNYVSSSENLADILTKPLAKEAVVCYCVGIGIHDQHYGAYTEAGEVLKGLQMMLYYGVMAISIFTFLLYISVSSTFYC